MYGYQKDFGKDIPNIVQALSIMKDGISLSLIGVEI
jgi:hypothetical protein